MDSRLVEIMKASRKYQNRRGLSLIDMVVTVLILGIVSAVAAPRFSNALVSSQLKSAGQRIVADLQFARNQAKTKSDLVTVQFLTSPDRYVISGVNHPDRKAGDYIVEISEICPSYSAITPSFDGETSFQFTHLSTAQVGSPATNLSSGSIVLAVGSDSIQINIDPVSGQVSLQ